MVSSVAYTRMDCKVRTSSRGTGNHVVESSLLERMLTVEVRDSTLLNHFYLQSKSAMASSGGSKVCSTGAIKQVKITVAVLIRETIGILILRYHI
jgi:hypothetical protein